MAEPFVLTTKLLVQLEGMGQVLAQIRSAIQGFKIDVPLGLSPQAAVGLQAVNAGLTQTSAGAKRAVADVNAFAGAMGQAAGPASTLSRQLQVLQGSSASVVSGLSGAREGASRAATSFEHFGAQVGLAARRMASFVVGAGVLLQTARALREGFTEAVAFDRELIRLAQVSGDTASQVAVIGDEVTRVAQKFGVSSRELLRSAVVLKQTGLTAREVAANLETLAQAALAPNFDTMAQTTEGMIAVMRQFKLDSTGVREAISAMNAVAGEFAVEAKDLVSGVQRAGGAFQQAGGSLNEFLALLTSVRSTTRESAETISTGLRTIFSRVQRGQTVDALAQLGIQLRHTREEARSAGDFGLENQFVGAYEATRRLSEGLSRLRTTDPRYSAVLEELGGYRQVSRVIPLIQQFGEAQRALNVAQAGGVSLTISAEKAQGALAVQAEKVKEQFLAIARDIVGSQGFKGLVGDLLNLASGFGTLLGIVKPLVPLLTTMAAVKIGQGLFSLFSGAAGFGAGVIRGVTKSTINPPGHAAGGYVRGFSDGGVVPGVGSADNFPARLTPGEFIIKKASAQQIGYDQLHDMNRGRYAAGGRVNIDTPTGKDFREALKYYQISSTSLNSALRGKDSFHGTPRVVLEKKAEQIKLLDQGIAANQTTKDVVVYRGIPRPNLEELAGAGLGNDKIVGKILQDPAYLSTTSDLQTAQGFAGHDGIILHIRVPAGKNVASMEELFGKRSGRNKEKELLFGRNSQVKIDTTEHKPWYMQQGVVGAQMLAKGGVASDTVPALLTPGEFVFRREAAQAIGRTRLDDMNRTGQVRGYASGGVVQRFAEAGEVKQIQLADRPGQFTNQVADEFKKLGLNAKLINAQLEILVKTVESVNSAGKKVRSEQFAGLPENTIAAVKATSAAKPVPKPSAQNQAELQAFVGESLASKYEGLIRAKVRKAGISDPEEAEQLARVKLEKKLPSFDPAKVQLPRREGENEAAYLSRKETSFAGKTIGFAISDYFRGKNRVDSVDQVRYLATQPKNEVGEINTEPLSNQQLFEAKQRLSKIRGTLSSGSSNDVRRLASEIGIDPSFEKKFGIKRLRERLQDKAERIEQDYFPIARQVTRPAGGALSPSTTGGVIPPQKPPLPPTTGATPTPFDDDEYRKRFGRLPGQNPTRVPPRELVGPQQVSLSEALAAGKVRGVDTQLLEQNIKHEAATRGVLNSLLSGSTKVLLDFNNGLGRVLGFVRQQPGQRVTDLVNNSGPLAEDVRERGNRAFAKSFVGTYRSRNNLTDEERQYQEKRLDSARFEEETKARREGLAGRFGAAAYAPNPARDVIANKIGDLYQKKDILPSEVYEKRLSALQKELEQARTTPGAPGRLNERGLLGRATPLDLDISDRGGDKPAFPIEGKLALQKKNDELVRNLVNNSGVPVPGGTRPEVAYGLSPLAASNERKALRSTGVDPLQVRQQALDLLKNNAPNEDTRAQFENLVKDLPANQQTLLRRRLDSRRQEYAVGLDSENIYSQKADKGQAEDTLRRAQLEKELAAKPPSPQKGPKAYQEYLAQKALLQTELAQIQEQEAGRVLPTEIPGRRLRQVNIADVQGDTGAVNYGLISQKAQEQARAELDRLSRGGAVPVSQQTKDKVVTGAFAKQGEQVERDLLAAEQKLLKSIYPRISKSEALAVAEENVKQAMNGLAKVTRDNEGKLYGLAATVDKARAAGLTPTGVSGTGGGIGGFNLDNTRFGTRIRETASSFGTAALFGLPLLGAGLEHLGGDARTAIAGGSGGESRYGATRATSGALSGLASGAFAGAAVGSLIPGGTIIGGAVGALGGAIIGAVNAFKDAEKEIRQTKIGDALTVLTDRLHVLAIAGPGASGEAISTAREQLNTYFTQTTEKNRREATGFFSGFNLETFQNLQRRSTREDLGSQLPQFTNTISRSAQQLGRSAPNANTGELLAQLSGGNAGLNRQFLSVIAEVRGLSFNQVLEEFRKEIKTAQRTRRIEVEQTEGGRGDSQNASAFVTLLRSVQGASDSLTTLRQQSEVLAQTFDKANNAVGITLNTESLGQLGRPDRGALEPLGTIGRVGGVQGRRLEQAGIAIDRVANILPSILSQEASAQPLRESQDFVTSVTNALRRQLGNPQGEVSPAIERVINSVRNQLNVEGQGEGGQGRILQSINVDVSRLTGRLIQPQTEAVGNTGAQILTLFEKNAKEFLDGLSRLRQQILAVGDSLDKEKSAIAAAVRNTAEQTAYLTGRRGDVLNFISLAQQERPFRLRQERLTGDDSPFSLNPEAIGAALRDTQGRLSGATAERQRLAVEDPRSSAFRAASTELERLRGRAADLQTALQNLTNVSERSAGVQERISSLREEENSRLSFGERFLRASPEEQSRTNNSLALANVLNQRLNAGQGGLDTFPHQERTGILDVLRSLGSTRLTGFEGQPRASDLADAGVRASYGGAADLAPSQRDEIRALLVTQREYFAAGTEAARQTSQSQVGLRELLANVLGEQNRTFLDRLDQLLRRSQTEDLRNQAGTAGTRLEDLRRQSPQVRGLREAGIDTTNRAVTAQSLQGTIQEYFGIVQEDERRRTAAQSAIQTVNRTFQDQVSAPGATNIVTEALVANQFGRMNSLRASNILSQVGAERYLSSQRFPSLNEDERSSITRNFETRGVSIVQGINQNTTPEALRESLQSAMARAISEYFAADPTAAARNRIQTTLSAANINPAPLAEVGRSDLINRNAFLAALNRFGQQGLPQNDRIEEFDRVLTRAIANLERLQARAGNPFLETINETFSRIPRLLGGSSDSFATGGAVGLARFEPRGTDTVPAMLTPGEHVINARSAAANRPILEAINNARGPLRMSSGGVVYLQNGGEPETQLQRIRRAEARDAELEAARLAREADNAAIPPQAAPVVFEEETPLERVRRRIAEERAAQANTEVSPAIQAVRERLARERGEGQSEALQAVRERQAREAGEAQGISPGLRAAQQRALSRRPNLGANPYNPNQGFNPFQQPEGEQLRAPRFDGPLSEITNLAERQREFQRREQDRENRFVGPRLPEEGLAEARFNADSPIQQRIRDRQAGRALPGEGAGVPAQGGAQGNLIQQAFLNPGGQSGLSVFGPQAAYASNLDLLRRRTANTGVDPGAAFGLGRADFGTQQNLANQALQQRVRLQAAGQAAFGSRQSTEQYLRTQAQQLRVPYNGIGVRRFAEGGVVGAQYFPIGGMVREQLDREADPGVHAILPAAFSNNSEVFLRSRQSRPEGIARGRSLAETIGGYAQGEDRIPALLQAGEGVLTRRAVNRLGKLGVDNINRYADGGVVGYAAGGSVSAGGTGGPDTQALIASLTAFVGSANKISQAGENFARFGDGITNFAAAAEKLGSQLEKFPSRLDAQISGEVNVTLNGAEAVARMSEGLGEMVQDAVRAQLGKVFKEQMPESGITLE